MSEDRYTYPTEGGDDPRDIDREKTDPDLVAPRTEKQHPSHDQPIERDQGLTTDKPGIDPSDRERDGGQPTGD